MPVVGGRQDLLLDDLARTLVTPMPRRRALRVALGLVAAAALPRAASARQMPGKCLDPNFPANCGPIYPDKPEGNDWCCAKQSDCFRDPRTGQGGRCCPPAKRCGSFCCDQPDQKCRDGECVFCEDDKVCGRTCCGRGEYCGSPRRSVCCPNGHNVCVQTGGGQGQATCCDPRKGERCCFSESGAACCKEGQPCRNGRCICRDGRPRCGDTCCSKGETCSEGRCCPKGEVRCGSRCCPRSRKCCGEKCCAKGEVCSDGKCCPKGSVKCGERCCPEDNACCSTGSGQTCCERGVPCVPVAGDPGKKTCCPKSRLAVRGGRGVCCPAGTVVTADGGCCPPGAGACCASDELDCLGRTICVRGVCRSY